MEAWRPLVGQFEFSMLFIIIHILSFVFIVYTSKPNGSVGKRAGGKCRGPGFDPQVPTFIHNIFPQEIQRFANQEVHHIPSGSGHPIHQRPRSTYHHWRTTMRPSQTCTLDQAKSKGPGSFRLKISNNTPLKIANTGPYFFFFF